MPKSASQPKKPYPDFPLTPHRNGQWCKKIRGKLHYFGTDADQALTKYVEVRDDLQAGRQPRKTTGLTLRELVNQYLTMAENRREAGNLSALSFRDYHWTGKQILDHFGASVDPEQIRPTDFGAFRNALAAKYAPSRLGKTITVCRMIFRWGYESELLDRMPRFGPDFKAATERDARRANAPRGANVFTANDILNLLSRADATLKAMILLGINGGLGNTDVSELVQAAVNLDTGWIDSPRPKTSVPRRFPLWNETVDSLRVVIENRPTPRLQEHGDRVFLTARGREFVVVNDDGRRVDKITLRFRKLLQECDLYRKQTGFYLLRHTFQSIGDEAKDPLATARIMGHADGSMGGVYREAISDERLQNVVQLVHHWLFSASQPSS